MKNLRFLPAIAIVTCLFAACSIHVPWEALDDYDGVRVTMRITPDDADVLLNGRFIGAAYEYAAPDLALRLASRENELVFRKKGFREKAVDLRAYPSRRITLKFELASEGSPAPAVPVAGKAGDEEAYQAQSEPLKPLPAEPAAVETEPFLTQVALKVTPEEASVYIDGRFWALAPAGGQAVFLRLPPGKYAFAVFKPGYPPFSKEISVPQQEKFDLEIALKK
ncbi:MAG: PEGA domain-containing protein [Acidobacteria bacterium]|jgi:hypothetical protein|nr:PEGA domain-containing protein [Acidobacteriota bacterium]